MAIALDTYFKLSLQRMGCQNRSQFWIITRCQTIYKNIPKWIRIFYLAKSGIRLPDCLWKTVYRFNMLHFDTQIDILKECGEHIVAESIDILAKCFERFVDVYRNSPIGTNDGLYNQGKSWKVACLAQI